MKVEIAVTVAAPPAPIWHALITPKVLDQWLSREAQFDARVGRPYRMVLPIGDEPVVATGRVTAWVPEVRLSYTMVGTPWGVDTTVTLFLACQEGGQTRITLVHDGFKKLANKRRAEVVAELETFWSGAFDRLQSYLGVRSAALV